MNDHDSALDAPLLERAKEAISRLRAKGAPGDDGAHELATLDALVLAAARQIQAEARLRMRYELLGKLARNEALSSGDLVGALGAITEAACSELGVARSSVWTYGPERSSIRCVDIYVAADHAHDRGVELPATSYPRYFAALAGEQMIAAHDAHRDERTSEFSVGYLRPLGIESMLDAPIRVGGRMIGVLCNEHTGKARTWTADEEQFAASLSALIALAFESSQRKDVEAQLRAMVESLESEAG